MKTSDRELLELAAKAAGIAGEYDPFRDQFRLYFKGQNTFLSDELWNPRDDDGDTLRLANKLSFDIVHSTGVVFVGNAARDHWHACVKVEGDIDDATRLAVLRAAAEIGKAMP